MRPSLLCATERSGWRGPQGSFWDNRAMKRRQPTTILMLSAAGTVLANFYPTPGSPENCPAGEGKIEAKAGVMWLLTGSLKIWPVALGSGTTRRRLRGRRQDQDEPRARQGKGVK